MIFDASCMIDNFDISVSPHSLLFSAVSRACSTEAGPGCLQNNFIINFFRKKHMCSFSSRLLNSSLIISLRLESFKHIFSVF